MGSSDVQGLLDKQAIQEVLMRYCRGIDRCDVDLLRSVYHADALDDHGNFKGTGWAFADWAVERLLRVPQRTTHVLGNVQIDLAGDIADTECYAVGTHVIEDEGGTTIYEYHCRYLDRFERRDDLWAIARRDVVHDWNERRTITPAFDRDDSRFVQGRRDRDDPVYRSR